MSTSTFQWDYWLSNMKEIKNKFTTKIKYLKIIYKNHGTAPDNFITIKNIWENELHSNLITP